MDPGNLFKKKYISGYSNILKGFKKNKLRD